MDRDGPWQSRAGVPLLADKQVKEHSDRKLPSQRCARMLEPELAAQRWPKGRKVGPHGLANKWEHRLARQGKVEGPRRPDAAHLVGSEPEHRRHRAQPTF